MKTHPAIEKLIKAKATTSEQPAGVLEGFLEVGKAGSVKVHAAIGGGLVWDVDMADVLHDEEVADSNGKTRLVLNPGASISSSFTAAASALTDGTYCGGSGTMYCWQRVRLPGGIYIILLVPCGSCIPGAHLVSPTDAVFER